VLAHGVAARRSKKIDPIAFLGTLEEGELPPVLAIGGPEHVLTHDALAILRRRALAGGIADFNHDRLDARTHGIQTVLNTAKMLPTMAPRRLVEVDRSEELREEAIAPLEAFLADPPPETTLVFIFGALDLRQKVPKLLNSKVPVAKFDHPRESQMPGLVRQRARRLDLNLTHEVAEGIALTVGSDLGFLERALEKLVLVAEGKRDKKLTLDDVSTHVADTHLEDAFAFGAAIAAGDRAQALARLNALQQNRDAPLKLLGLVAWQLRQLVRARALLDEGLSDDEITRQLKAWGDRAQSLMSGARRFEMRQHERRLGRLALYDRKIKSSPAPDWRWMERMVLELCPPARKQVRA
jgi:DNA polymerase-3 subunit delta